MNKAHLIGRLTKNIEVSQTQNMTSVASFTLAVDRRKKEQGADFIRCKAWGRTAEVLCRYVSKGDPLAVSGRIETGSYEKNGQTVYTTEVVVEDFDFIPTKHKEETPQRTSYGTVENDGYNYEYDLPF